MVNLTRFFRRSHEDAELSQELEFHLAHEIDDNLARGMDPAEARRLAYVKLGNPLSIRDQVWGENRIAWLEDTWRDLHYATRTLARTPSFTVVALLVMALGIGANTAIYSFLDALLLRSLPVSDPSSLVVVNWHAKALQQDFVMQSMSGDVESDPHSGSVSDIFPYPAFSIFAESHNVFSDVFAYCHGREVRAVNFSVNGRAETASGELVSGSYFRGLGIIPVAGRLLTQEDDRIGAPGVVVVSHGFSERHFGSPHEATGRPVMMNNVPFTIVGVAPQEFFGVDPSVAPDFYVPMHDNLLLGAADPFGFRPADYLDGNYYWVEIMARLRPGVTLAQAQAQLATRFQQWVATTATNDQQRSNLPIIHLKEGGGGIDTLRRRFSKPFFVLMVLVALILAIACSNVANLLLARASVRRREIALRLSQGASRSRIIRQLLTESILLSTAAGALGILFAVWGIHFLTALLGERKNHISLDAHLNWHVLALTAGLAVLTGVVFGLAPALQSTKVDLTSALKETRGNQPRRFSGARRRRMALWPVSVNQILVVGQIALSLLILIAAGLFVRTLSNLQSVNLGFNRENLLLFEVNARQSGHRDPEIAEFYSRLREQLSSMPGVRDAGLARGSLIGGEEQMPISLPGAKPDDANRFLTVGPSFLTTMQIPMVAGRDIEEHDRPGSQPVAVINEEFARRNFSGQNPLGHHLILWRDEKPARDMEIVGVARNATYGNLKNSTMPVIYLPYDQGYPEPSEMMFAVRTTGDPLSFVKSIREIVHEADARLPVSKVRTQKSEVQEGMRQETVLAGLCSAFAILALTIACVGLYGTISYSVARRTGEIGIRMALGARRGPVLRMVLREVLGMAMAGLAISLPVALVTSKFIQSFLFHMKANDPVALTEAVLILLLAALVAGCIPARRASHIDPMTALRHE